MNYQFDTFIVRRPEPDDLPALYEQKNDPEIANLLGGFTIGYSMADLADWLEYHRKNRNEALWVIADRESNNCWGHVGLYNIDHRIRCAEFAIMIGHRSAWGQGVGRKCTQFVLEYGFEDLNLNRIYLSVLATNERAINLYLKIGFREEGKLEQAQYKGGCYVDVVLMRILRKEYLDNQNA